MSVALIIITSASGKRETLIDEHILPAARAHPFDDVLVVGDHHDGDGYRYLPVPSLTRTTIDALVKRDVGALATGAEVLFYISDDHAPAVGDMRWLQPTADWDVIVPLRYTVRAPDTVGLPSYAWPPNAAGNIVVPLPNGQAGNPLFGCERYCAGHGIVIKRWVVSRMPWSTMPHHPNWDILASQRQQALGAKFLTNLAGVEVWDHEWRLKPESTPWR